MFSCPPSAASKAGEPTIARTPPVRGSITTIPAWRSPSARPVLQVLGHQPFQPLLQGQVQRGAHAGPVRRGRSTASRSIAHSVK